MILFTTLKPEQGFGEVILVWYRFKSQQKPKIRFCSHSHWFFSSYSWVIL